jgi:hypothetical protein
MDGGSARRKASTYTQDNTNTDTCPNWDSNPRSQRPCERIQFMPQTTGLPWPAPLSINIQQNENVMYEADVLYNYLDPLLRNMVINMNLKYRETSDILFMFYSMVISNWQDPFGVDLQEVAVGLIWASTPIIIIILVSPSALNNTH